MIKHTSRSSIHGERGSKPSNLFLRSRRSRISTLIEEWWAFSSNQRLGWGAGKKKMGTTSTFIITERSTTKCNIPAHKLNFAVDLYKKNMWFSCLHIKSCSISKYNFLQTPFNIVVQDNGFQNYQREISNERNLIMTVALNLEGLNDHFTIHRNTDN